MYPAVLQSCIVTIMLTDYANEAVPAYHVSRSCTLEYLPETMTSCRSDLRRDEELENFKLRSREADYHTANWTGNHINPLPADHDYSRF